MCDLSHDRQSFPDARTIQLIYYSLYVLILYALVMYITVVLQGQTDNSNWWLHLGDILPRAVGHSDVQGWAQSPKACKAKPLKPEPSRALPQGSCGLRAWLMSSKARAEPPSLGLTVVRGRTKPGL